MSPSVVPKGIAHIRIQNCYKVHVLPHTWVHHREVRHVEFINIEELIIESNAFSWNETLALEPFPQPGLVVSTVNSSIPEIPSYTFNGRITGITFHNVSIGTIRAFAFASLYSTEKLELSECFVTAFEAQAFKKFSLEKLHIIGGHFHDSVPSRTWVDLEVDNEMLIERVTIETIRSSAFIIHGPKTFRLYGNNFGNVEGEAFRIKMRGKTLIQNNIFKTLAKGAFISISTEDFVIKMKGLQRLQFENNTVGHFESGCFLFNMTSFEVQLDNVILNLTCSCTLLEIWGSELSSYSPLQGQQNSPPQMDASDRMWCHEDTEDKNGRRYIKFKDYSQQCILISGLHMFIIIIVTCSLLLLVLVILVIFLWNRYRSRHQRQWISVPGTPNNDKKKKRINKASNIEKISANGQDSGLTVVVPDGRTYRETELHVIIERTEPIVEHEYVDTAVDERAKKIMQ